MTQSSNALHIDVQKDYYAILGVLDSAEDIVIKGAYRALAQRYHPDRFAGGPEQATQRMGEINEAYRVLSNSELRAQYDRERREQAQRDQNQREQERRERERRDREQEQERNHWRGNDAGAWPGATAAPTAAARAGSIPGATGTTLIPLPGALESLSNFEIEQYRPFAERLQGWGYGEAAIHEALLARGIRAALAEYLARAVTAAAVLRG